MKKLITLSLVAASTLFAGSINVNAGWNLVGAVEDLNPSDVACTKTAWTYDNTAMQWRLYTNTSYGYLSPSEYGYGGMTNIAKGQGFWLNSDCQTTIEYSDTNTSSSYFDMFGFYWEDVKKDDRYTVLGNTVSHDSSIVTLETAIKEDLDSRTEVRTSLSTPSKSVSSTLKITQTDTGYNKLEFRAYSNVTISSDVKTALGLNSTNVRSYSVIGMTGKKIYSYVYLDDGTTEAKVYDSQDAELDGVRESENSMYYNETTSILVGKTIDMNITTNGSSVTFSATDQSGGISISPVTFTPPTGTIISDTDQIVIRTKILDDYANTDGNTAGAIIKAEINSVTTDTSTSSDNNITYATATAVSLDTLTNAINFEQDDAEWYSTFTKSGTAFTYVDNEYEDGVWVVEETSTGTIAVSTSDSSMASISFPDGFAADFKVNSTQQITSINGVSYTDLFISDTSMTVTASGTPWTDTWGHEPMNYSTSTPTSITTTEEFLSMSLSSNNWFGGDQYYPMLSGTTTGTIGDAGDVVAGTFTGYCDNDGDGVLDTDCKMVVRSTTIIGDWELTSAGIVIDTPDEINTVSIISNSTETTSGYDVQSIGIDKVGSVWNEKMITGTQATPEIVEQLSGI